MGAGRKYQTRCRTWRRLAGLHHAHSRYDGGQATVIVMTNLDSGHARPGRNRSRRRRPIRPRPEKSEPANQTRFRNKMEHSRVTFRPLIVSRSLLTPGGPCDRRTASNHSAGVTSSTGWTPFLATSIRPPRPSPRPRTSPRLPSSSLASASGAKLNHLQRRQYPPNPSAFLPRSPPASSGSRTVPVTLGLSGQTMQVGHFSRPARTKISLSRYGRLFRILRRRRQQAYGTGGEPERLTSVPVSQNFFSLLASNLSSRLFTTDDAVEWPSCYPPQPRLWQRRFRLPIPIVANPSLSTIQPSTVVGVLPASFDFATDFRPGSPGY